MIETDMDDRLDIAASYYRAAREARQREIDALFVLVSWLPLGVLLGLAGWMARAVPMLVVASYIAVRVLSAAWAWYRARLELERTEGEFDRVTGGFGHAARARTEDRSSVVRA